MDLSSGKVEQGTSQYPIMYGWLNALHDKRDEARGYFVIQHSQALSLAREPIIIQVFGLSMSVVLIQSRPSGLPGFCRQRFVASCQASLFRPLMHQNPDLTKTQEWFDRTDLTTLILDDIRTLDRNFSSPHGVTPDAKMLNE
jgi:hypothetical protein